MRPRSMLLVLMASLGSLAGVAACASDAPKDAATGGPEGGDGGARSEGGATGVDGASEVGLGCDGALKIGETLSLEAEMGGRLYTTQDGYALFSVRQDGLSLIRLDEALEPTGGAVTVFGTKPQRDRVGTGVARDGDNFLVSASWPSDSSDLGELAIVDGQGKKLWRVETDHVIGPRLAAGPDAFLVVYDHQGWLVPRDAPSFPAAPSTSWSSDCSLQLEHLTWTGSAFQGVCSVNGSKRVTIRKNGDSAADALDAPALEGDPDVTCASEYRFRMNGAFLRLGYTYAKREGAPPNSAQACGAIQDADAATMDVTYWSSTLADDAERWPQWTKLATFEGVARSDFERNSLRRVAQDTTGYAFALRQTDGQYEIHRVARSGEARGAALRYGADGDLALTAVRGGYVALHYQDAEVVKVVRLTCGD
ncbi:MAG: hypothetical protein KF850_14125 [Labilithrix sp.]|nr:hypothetical protein [Labilithrix sp.]MBX3213168.1 hypothetical protein [Labilithrix sp.]